jgi:sporulation protein YlmC with PRC-barrel domain
MAARELNVELLLSRRVYALNGRRIGRIEEIRAEKRGREWYVTEYLVGGYALFERLAGWVIGRAILNTVGMRASGRGYRVPWNELDLSDPDRPRLKCSVSSLAPIEEEA